jgi:hypothetical protein
MAINLKDLAQHLDRRDWKYELFPDANQIITGIQSDRLDNFLILLRLTDGGELLQFHVPQILSIKDSVYKGVIFQTMLAMNYYHKLVKFEYDPLDGEVAMGIEIPLQDNTLTAAQFDFCLEGLIQMVELAMPRLKQVLATGIDPGLKYLAKTLVENLSPDLLELVREMSDLLQEQTD